MADVFKARVQGPAGFERTFVIKRILPHLSDDPSFTKMFIDEAKLAAKLNHPNIVQVFELGSVENEYFMSMEYVRGRDLAETMRTLWARVGPPRPELVAYIGREMCRALAYAHDFTTEDGQALGMIHRDISPSNVMLSYDGAVKILDFGIAKALGTDAQDESTKSGTLKGKFAYMSPEQTASNEIDRRIDIFATGIVLHEILTGRRLFKGENDLQTIERVRKCEVLPPSLHNPLCPPELDAIVMQALSKNREDRFQSGSEMADALDDVVYSARFQPTHLAQTMRGLFPADSGGEQRVGGPIRSNNSLTGSVSPSKPGSGISKIGPHPTRQTISNTRSPTVPPIVAMTGSYSSAPQSASNVTINPTIPAPWLARPLLGPVPAWVVMTIVLLIGFSFVGGAYLTRVKNNVPTQTPIKLIFLDLAFQSSPMGADVYVVGRNEYLGRTPFRQKVEYRDDKPSFVVFRKTGFQEITQEVNPSWPPTVILPPIVPTTTPVVPVAPNPPVVTTIATTTSTATSTSSGKPGRKGSGKGKKKSEGDDPFEEGGILKTTGGTKSNPF